MKNAGEKAFGAFYSSKVVGSFFIPRSQITRNCRRSASNEFRNVSRVDDATVVDTAWVDATAALPASVIDGFAQRLRNKQPDEGGGGDQP